jgi:homoserine kinase
MSQVTVTVPATTANLGVGFDCLGAALSLYNEFEFTTLDSSSPLLTGRTSTFLQGRCQPLTIEVRGEETAKVSTDESNLLYRSFSKFYREIDRTPPAVAITINLGVPLARGLGSSATAIVGGLLAANQLEGNPLSQQEIQELAIAIEGHPDNVVPALLGNCQLSIGEPGNWCICPITWHQNLIPVVAIPDFELSTEEARAVLPKTIKRQDAIFNISRMGLLLRGLATNDGDWLKIALEDRLHQPYRQNLIRGYAEVKQAAIASGAYGMVISGAGPTLLALTQIDRVSEVVAGMQTTWQSCGIKAKVQALSLDVQGAKVK